MNASHASEVPPPVLLVGLFVPPASLTALCTILPSRARIAYVAIGNDALADELRMRAAFVVQAVRHPTTIEPNRLYLLDENVDFHITRDRLEPTGAQSAPSSPGALLRRLADAHCEHTVAVVGPAAPDDVVAAMHRVVDAGGLALKLRTAADARRLPHMLDAWADASSGDRRDDERHDALDRPHGDELIRMAVESSRDYAIFTMDTHGRITTWNPGAERLFGYARDDAIGRIGHEIFVPEDRVKGVPETEMRLAREEGRADDERWHLRKDGTRFYCSGIMTSLIKDGVLHGYAKIARDLTGRKSAEALREERLRRESAERMTAQADNQLKDEFLAVMSHELKNPLNLIHLNAEFLTLTPEVRAVPSAARAAEMIRRSVIGQAQIIDDLLDMSRVNTGKLSLSRQAVDWAQSIESIARALSPEAVERDIRLDVALGSFRPMVDADPVRVEQIVWNLLSNALKFTPSSGRVTVSLRPDGGQARLDVSDTGRGIDAADLPGIFDMFRQVRHDGQRQRGLGIGLALVRQLAELHGGRVEATSPGRGAGSTFSVWLPLHAHRGAGHPVDDQAFRVLKGLRVLVVDDAQENTDALRDLLRLAGCVVTTANTAADALRLVEQEPIDLLLSDLAMPQMDGLQLIQALRGNPKTASLPAIALSGFGRTVDTQRALQAGFDAHLRKPFALEQLLTALAPLRPDRP